MIVVIGCGKRKLAVPAPARDLYTGSLFRACRRYAESLPGCNGWAILSAERGLVLPGEELEPYERKLTLKGEELRAWATRAAFRYEQLFGSLECQSLAGARYSMPFTNELYQRGIRSVEPLAGYELGPRLSWLKHRYEQEGQRAAV